MQPLPRSGVGLAYQAPLAPLIAAAGKDLGYVEIVPDILWTDAPARCARRQPAAARGAGEAVRPAR